MGLGLSLVAKRPDRRWFGLWKRYENWPAVFAAAARQVCQKAGVEFLLTDLSEISQNRLGLNLCEEHLDIEVKDSTIWLAARTTTCGPGYHALVCDFADHLGSRFGLKFEEDEENFDETGYFRERDFARLQYAHAEWLRALGGSVTSNSTTDNKFQTVALAIDSLLPLGGDGIIFTPNGPQSLALFEAMRDSSESDLIPIAKAWFPWWDREPSPRDFRMMGTRLMWTDVPWHVPWERHERRVMAAVQSCFEEASKDPNEDAKIPVAEFEELRRLLASRTNEEIVPNETGIGYRRQVCTWPFPDRWSCQLPGYWRTTQHDLTLQIHFGERSLSMSVYTVKGGDQLGDPRDALDAIEDTDELIEEFVQNENFFRITKPKIKRLEMPVIVKVEISGKQGSLLLLLFISTDETWRSQIPSVIRTVRQAPKAD
jgi:hypothetical protein